MFCTYILYSKKLNSFYKGETGNIVDRLNRHNCGYEKATQSGVPWILVWNCEKSTKSEAKILELKLKNLSVKRTIDFILKYKQYVPSSDELLIIQKFVRMLTSTSAFNSRSPTLTSFGRGKLATKALKVCSGLFYLNMYFLPYKSRALTNYCLFKSCQNIQNQQ